MDRKRKSQSDENDNKSVESKTRKTKAKRKSEPDTSTTYDDMFGSAITNGSHISSRMLTNMEITMQQRAVDMSVEYIKASALVTCRRIEDIKKHELNGTFSSKDGYKKQGILDSKKYGNFHEITKRQPRRRELPTKPKKCSNLWSVIRNCIGKDISTLTIPVGFSEPISMLQRLAEEFEYSHILDSAAVCNDPLEQLAIVSAFVVSAYSSSGERLTKPFTPVLGETYELDRRDDMGWRLMSEQVLQSPPTSAQFCESHHWRCWKTFSISTMFRGKYLKITPSGITHLALDTGTLITWDRVDSTVNNILVGKMWLDNIGEISVIDCVHNNKCTLAFLPFDPMNRANQRKVKGVVTDCEGQTRWLLEGKWDSHVEITPVRLIGDNIEAVASSKMIWQVNEINPGTSIYYNFSLFACQLNEPEDFTAPTDSRRRKDIRLMEDGSWEEADSLKRSIEQKWRDENKRTINQLYEPIWFTPTYHPITQYLIYVFNDTYWKAKAIGDWTICPNIF